MLAFSLLYACARPVYKEYYLYGDPKSFYFYGQDDGVYASDYLFGTSDGGARTLASDKVTVCLLWAGWCQYSMQAVGDMAGLSAELPNVDIIYINCGDTEEEARKIADLYGIPEENIVFDPNSLVYAAVGFTSLPNTIIIDTDGRLVRIFEGYTETEKIKEYVSALA